MFKLLFTLASVLFFITTFAQSLISDSLIAEYDVQVFINNNFPGATYDVDVYKIVYTTLDGQGESTIASGLLALPVVSCDLPVTVYCHGTVAEKEDVPSRLNSEGELGAAIASNGYVAILPDYVGLGDSPGLHPYVHAHTEAEASFHMIRAVEQFCFENDIVLNGQLFLTGYSQGGHSSMALLKYIQEYEPDDFVLNVEAAVCGSGPYDISGAQTDQVLAEEPYGTGAYLPYVMFAYQSVYGNLYPSVDSFLVEPYNTTLPPLFNGEYGIWQIQQSMPAIPNDILIEEQLQSVLNDSLHPVNVALRDNDLYDWTPAYPLRMIYCTNDEQVTHLNTLKAEEVMLANGATNVEAVNAGTGGHGECFQPYLINFLVWFDQLKEDCLTSVLSPESILHWDIFPNPVTDKFFVSVDRLNDKPFNILISDLTGKLVFQEKDLDKDLIEIQATNFNQGVYMISLEMGSEFKTKRLVIR